MSDDRAVLRFPTADLIEESAAHWAAKMDSRPLTLSEQAEFRRWLGESERHREAFDEMTQVWRAGDILDAYAQIEPLEQNSGGVIHRPLAIGVSSLAACLALVAGMVFFLLKPTGVDQVASFETMLGEQREIVLHDGSTAFLNTDSVLQVDFDGRERRISLVKGEAHFEVSEDPDRPFVVYAGDGLVRAIGTAFSVRLIEDETVEVIVSEGVVELLSRSPGREVAASSPETEPDGEDPDAYKSLAALTVNESALFDDELEQKEKMNAAAVERKLMWRDGFIAFAGEPLSEVVAEMSRYTDVTIEIDDADLGEIPIGAVFRAGDIEAMLDALRNVFDIDMRKEGQSHYVLVRRT